MKRTKCFFFFLVVLLSFSATAKTYQGELKVLVFDYFNQNKSKTTYQLETNNGAYLLEIPPSINTSHLLSGTSVIIEGKEKITKNLQGKAIQVKSITINQPWQEDHSALSENRAVLTLLINFNNNKEMSSSTVSTINSMLYNDSFSIKHHVNKSSFGQVNYIGDANNDGINDTYIINLNYNLSSSCEPDKWAIDALNAASQAGINIAPYRHRLFILGKNVQCPWAGLGSLGCGSTCEAWVRMDPPSFIQDSLAHELGHNLGMNHSSTDTNNDGVNDGEYNDHSCAMGNGLALKEFNAPHRDQLHWFDAFPQFISTVNFNGQYTLYSLEMGTTSPGLLALKMKKNSNEMYYVSYRTNLGPYGPINPEPLQYLNRVNIHRTQANNAYSYFITSLGAGESFVDPVNKVTITAVSTNGNNAVVNVNVNVNSDIALNSCTYSLGNASLTCTASGNLLSLGSPATLYRKYTGASCALNNQIQNVPGTAVLTDTQYISQTGVPSSVVGCNVALCNNSSCSNLKTTSAPVAKGAALTKCVYNTCNATLICLASQGGLLNLGAAQNIYRKYTGNCPMAGQISNTPSTAVLTDTRYVTQSGVPSSVIGCSIALCNKSTCNELVSSSILNKSSTIASCKP